MIYDVAIVGAGPVGMTLANLLGMRGMSVLVLEKQPKAYGLPRAVHFDGEVMRVFQKTGLAQEVLDCTLVGKGMLFKDAEDNLLVDWSRSQEIGPMGWNESYRFHQPGLEVALNDGLERFDHVTLKRGVAVSAIVQGADDVLVSADQDYTARYVVGADGAQSFVRKSLGIEVEDLGFAERWLIVDVRLSRNRDDLGDYSVQFCHPTESATYVRSVGDLRRWEIRLTGDEPADDAQVWERLKRWVSPDDGALERWVIYDFRSCLAQTWQKGRVFLAGDAAHQMPPFMGQGMCAGLRDIMNLAWKLADGRPEILETYGPERIPNVRQFIELTVALGKLINMTASEGVTKGRMASIWPQLGEGLGPRDEIAGRLVPQPDKADDVAGPNFYVLAQEDFDAPVPVFVGAQDWLKERGIFAVIVRPDGYALDSIKTQSDAAEMLAKYDAITSTLRKANVQGA